jgi:hypothetical protein
MKWVTRARPKEDRIACPWLIKRFVDQEAEFLSVPADQVTVVAEREGAIPFAAPGVELGHHGAECRFDAIVKKYELTDPALQNLALIVRGADPALQNLALIVRGADTADKDLTPEARSLEAIADGFRRLYDDDLQQLAAESIVYDALYAFCQQSAG